ncbi:MAG: hypothetical protein EOO38_29865 [Cytophagaceae bacterium]|nr:MAG: hypothetical protein EOO38_29865 [Cytophagaceae bacterium]
MGGGSSIESGKHYYNSQQGIEQMTLPLEQTFCRFGEALWRMDNKDILLFDSFEGVLGLNG